MVEMKIAISGLSGCGNTTACKNVSKALGLKIINYTFRDLAKELGVPLEELHEKSKGDPFFDFLVDKKQLQLAEKEENFVMGSRLAGWLLEDAELRVWLTASPEERARRIARREQISFEDAFRATHKRDDENEKRFKLYYGLDIRDLGGYDLILNTEQLSPEQVCAAIVEAARAAKESGLKKPGKIARAIREKVFSELEKREKALAAS